MSHWRTGLLAGLGVLSFSAAGHAPLPARAQAEPNWRTNYNAAAAEARSTGKPLLVAFR
ncbi:MAG: hypothetical protein ACO1SX_25540 [Actinomycetota bacterium]